jgi:uncharacterized protein (TIGR04255 family)
MQNSQELRTGERTKFTNPPITELVIGLFHLPLEGLRVQHIGSYWDRIRYRYPLCNQQPPIQVPDAAPGSAFAQMPDETFPLPRFWFHNTSHPTLIQIQRNAFMFNWRLLPALPNNEYPHYETVAKDFWQELENYKTFIQELFVRGKLDPIQRCELTYINVITPNELFSSAAEYARVVPPVASLYDLQNEGREVAGMIGSVTYRVNPTLFIDLAFRLGQRADTREVAVGLELKAHGVPSDLSLEAARDWFDAAHDATYKLFLDATSKEMQERIWRPR